MTHEGVGDQQIQVAGCFPVGKELAQLLVLARTRREGVRADPSHARDGLRDERGHLLFVQFTPLAGQVLKRAGIDAAERGLCGEHGAQQRGPPREVELGVDGAVLDVPVGEVLGQLVEASGGEALTHREAGRDLARRRGVARPPLDEGREALEVGAHEVRFFGDEHGGDRVKVVAHSIGEGRDLADLRGQDRPGILAAHRTPCVAALLDADESAVQVGHVHAGAHEVLGLLDEAVAFRSAHRNVVVFAPLLGGGRDDHVGRAAFEHAGLEHIEDVRDAVEHGELAVPLSQGAGGLDAGLARDCGDVDAQFGERLGQAVNAQQHVGRLLVRGEDRVPPRGG